MVETDDSNKIIKHMIKSVTLKEKIKKAKAQSLSSLNTTSPHNQKSKISDFQKNDNPLKEGDFIAMINILNKQFNDRTSKEISVISKFLEGSQLAHLFNQENENHEFKNILQFCSKHLTYEFLAKDDYLFYEGDKGDKFYFVISGSVKIIKTIENIVKMVPEEYLIYIDQIKEDKFLLNKTLNINKEEFGLDLDKVNDIHEIINVLQLRIDLDINPKNYLSEKIEKSTPDKIGGKKGKILRRGTISEAEKQIEKFHLNFLDRPYEERSVKIYKYDETVILQTGNYFGDVALENKDNIRTASIQGNEDTHLGYIPMKEYKYYIVKSKQEIEVKIAEKILNSFFFRYTNPRVFYINYFSYFSYGESKKGEIISEPDENLKRIMLIKEGELEYLYQDSLIKFKNFVQELCKKFGVKYILSKHEETFFSNTQNLKSMHKKKSLKIFLSGKDHIVGLETFYFQVFSEFLLKVNSNQIKYYYIPLSNFKNFIKSEASLSSTLEKSSYSKIKSLIERLIDIKNINIDLEADKSQNKNQIKDKAEYRRKSVEYQKNQSTIDNNQTQDLPLIKSKNDEKYNLNGLTISNKRQSLQSNTQIERTPPLTSRNPLGNFKDEIKKQNKTPVKVFAGSKKNVVYNFVNSKNNVGIKIITNRPANENKIETTNINDFSFCEEEEKLKKRIPGRKTMSENFLSSKSLNVFGGFKIHDNSQLKQILIKNERYSQSSKKVFM